MYHNAQSSEVPHMNRNIFRKSSIDRVNSPEQLNKYIRVTNPGIWLVLAAIVSLLVGVVIWGIFGTVENKVETGLLVDGSSAVCYVSAKDALLLKPGMTVTAEDKTSIIKSVASTPVQVKDSFDDYLLHLSGLTEGDFCYMVEVERIGLSDGVYAAAIVTETIHPISFVTK